MGHLCISPLKYLLEYYINFQVKWPERAKENWSFLSEGCTMSSVSDFQPWLQIIITWKSFYKHCCLCPSLRDSDWVDQEVRAWLLLLFKSLESEKGVWEGVSASCGLGLPATSPSHILSSGPGLLGACQLGCERESFRANVRRPRWKLQDFLWPRLRNLTASLLSHSICQASHQGCSRCKGRGIRLHLLLVECQITFAKSM